MSKGNLWRLSCFASNRTKGATSQLSNIHRIKEFRINVYDEEFDVLVTPSSDVFDFHLREVWAYRDLIFLLVKRNFISRYKQTVLGPAWAIIQPLLTTVVFTVVFGNLAGLAADGVPPFLFYLAGTVAWTYFASCLSQTADTFTGNAAILGKVYFPRLVMPISTVLTNLISFAIMFALFLVFLIVYMILGEVSPTPLVLMLPVLLIHMAALSLGVGIIVSALTTKYRDLRMLVDFGVQLWMYATPVAYDISIVPSWLMGAYMLNPMTPVITAFRNAFLGLGTFDWGYYGLSWIVTAILLFVGLVLFTKIERTFMDTV